MSRSDERWPWATPTATRQGITDRLRTRYPPAELQLRQVEVAPSLPAPCPAGGVRARAAPPIATGARASTKKCRMQALREAF